MDLVVSSYVLDKYATILSSTLYKQRFLVISLFGILNMKRGLLLRLKLSELSKVLTVEGLSEATQCFHTTAPPGD